MQIIFGKDVAEQLRSRYVVLELESFTVNDTQLDAYCVVPAEKIPMNEVSLVENNKDLHQQFVDSYKFNKFHECKTLYPQLKGLWGNELDSFYDTILNKCSSSST